MTLKIFPSKDLVSDKVHPIMQRNIWLWHLFILCGVVIFHALDFSELYRACLYLNVLFIGYLSFKHIKTKDKSMQLLDDLKLFYPAVLMLGIFAIVNAISVGEIEWNKELNRLFLIIFFCYGICLQVGFNNTFLSKNSKPILTIFMMLYVVMQLVYILVLNRPYGTLKNPHYLAQYSMLLIPISIFLFYKSSSFLKLIILITTACLLGLLLNTNSRPAWLSMIVTMVIMSFYHKRKLIALSTIAMTVVIIWASNLDNFAKHLSELFLNLKTEERTYIWRDTWNAQMHSSIKEWIFGRGLGSYETQYSHFGALEMGTTVTYNSPHNFVLEIINTAGLLGLILVLAFYCILYTKLFETLKNNIEYKSLSLLLISLLTMNVLFVAIVVPIFSSYHLLITAIVCGVVIYIKEQSKVAI